MLELGCCRCLDTSEFEEQRKHQALYVTTLQVPAAVSFVPDLRLQLCQASHALRDKFGMVGILEAGCPRSCAPLKTSCCAGGSHVRSTS